MGCAEYISSGEIKVKSGAEIQKLSDNTIFLTDGSTLEADIVIFAYVPRYSLRVLAHIFIFP